MSDEKKDTLDSLLEEQFTEQMGPNQNPGVKTEPMSDEELDALKRELLRQRAARRAKKLLDEEDGDMTGAESTGAFSRMVSGSSFIFGAEAKIRPVWGTEDRCWWPSGEGFMIVGPQGLGKTTVGNQLLEGRLGLGPGELLGLPIVPGQGKTLYLACDRPAQAARALARLFDEKDEEQLKVLEEKFVVWRGPLPVSLLLRPTILAEMAKHCGADTIVIDSLKDILPSLIDEDCGLAMNNSLQTCLRDGIEVLELHHSKKAAQTAAANATKSIDDIYGSTWLTAGLGSIMGLNGQPGDLVVRVAHLKQVNEDLGGIDIVHDHTTGRTTLADGFDMLRTLRNSPVGMSAIEGAALKFAKTTPSKNEVEKARRELERLVDKGLAKKQGGARGGAAGQNVARYVAVTDIDLLLGDDVASPEENPFLQDGAA